jgi:two-component system chemotaxis response regulator CheB
MTATTLRGRVDAIVIGASAGGVEALSAILPALPAGSVPVFVVMHIPRDHRSLLPEIFQGRTAATVVEAQDKEPIRPGTVYVAPPNYHLLIDDGPHVALSTDDLVNFSRPSIDVLFESAADVYGARLAAIVLTGASSDGATGLGRIARAGGVAIVQDPREAQVATMVESALTQAPAALRLRLADIAQLLQTLNVDVPRKPS